jgi:WD40 repeat protein
VPSNDGYFIATAGDGICLSDTSGHTYWCNYNEEIRRVTFVAIASDISHIIAASNDEGKLFYFDREGHLLWVRLTGTPIYSIANPSDGSYVVVSSYDEQFQGFNQAGDLQIEKYKYLGTGIAAHDTAVAGNGQYVVAGIDYGNKGKVLLFNSRGHPYWEFVTDGLTRNVAISYYGTYMAAGDWQLSSKKGTSTTRDK